MNMLINCDMEPTDSIREIEFSMKVSEGGLNNNRMIVSLDHDDPKINQYIGRFSDLAEDLFEQAFLYDKVLFGVDGNARKMYLENDKGTLLAIEDRGGRIGRKCYYRYDEPDPSVPSRSEFYPQVLCYNADESYNPVKLKTTHLFIFTEIEKCIPVLSNLAKRHAKGHYMSFMEWLKLESGAILTWLGLSDDSFTVYYMNELR